MQRRKSLQKGQSLQLNRLNNNMESEGGERPTRLSVLVSMMLMDMCCSTTLFTTLTDSQASDSCLAELSFLILAGVTSAVWLLLSSHSWYSTSLALSLFLASLTSSFLMRSLAAPDTPLHSLL